MIVGEDVTSMWSWEFEVSQVNQTFRSISNPLTHGTLGLSPPSGSGKRSIFNRGVCVDNMKQVVASGRKRNTSI